VTPEAEEAAIAATIALIEAEVRKAQEAVVAAIIAGEEPRAAVIAATAAFAAPMAEAMQDALFKILGDAVGEASDVPIVVGRIALSTKLYAEASATAEVVRGIVQRQASGFQDARRLALELFEGYAFRAPDAEPLVLAPGNSRLPKYLREALLAEADLQGDLQRAFARIQASGLSTGALRAAYTELLDEIDLLETGAGRKVLRKKLEVAFFERMRYFASRIARTELHRAYAEREALLLMQDVEVEFVQIRRAPGRHLPCICALLVGRDLYGLGAGIYPKAQAPVPPFHPFCMCVMSARLDLTGRTAKERDADGDRYFLRRLGSPMADRVVGSKDKLDQVMSGRRTPEEIQNAGRDSLYWLKTAGQVVAG